MTIKQAFQKKLRQLKLTATINHEYHWISLKNSRGLLVADIGRGFSSLDDGKIGFVVGYWLDESYRGLGLGSVLLTYWLREMKDLQRVHAMVEANNIASIRLLEKNGFRLIHEGEKERGFVQRLAYELQRDAENEVRSM